MTAVATTFLGHCYADRRQVIVDVDDAFLEIVGRDRSDVIGRPPLFCTYDRDLSANKPLLDGLSREGPAFAITKRYVRGDGSLVWVQNHVSAIRSGQGPPLLCATSGLRDRPFESVDLTRNYRRARQICAAFVSARVGALNGIAAAPAIEALLWLYRGEVEGRLVTVEELALDTGCTTKTMVRWTTVLRDRGLIESEEPLVTLETVVRIGRACERWLDGVLSQLTG